MEEKQTFYIYYNVWGLPVFVSWNKVCFHWMEGHLLCDYFTFIQQKKSLFCVRLSNSNSVTVGLMITYIYLVCTYVNIIKQWNETFAGICIFFKTKQKFNMLVLLRQEKKSKFRCSNIEWPSLVKLMFLVFFCMWVLHIKEFLRFEKISVLTVQDF